MGECIVYFLKLPIKGSGSEEKLFSILKFSYDNIQNDVEEECFPVLLFVSGRLGN